METGRITDLNVHGFGFIAPDRAGGEIWMRPARAAAGDQHALKEGLRVEFELAMGSLGLEAINVQPVSTAGL